MKIFRNASPTSSNTYRHRVAIPIAKAAIKAYINFSFSVERFHHAFSRFIIFFYSRKNYWNAAIPAAITAIPTINPQIATWCSP